MLFLCTLEIPHKHLSLQALGVNELQHLLDSVWLAGVLQGHCLLMLPSEEDR